MIENPRKNLNLPWRGKGHKLSVFYSLVAKRKLIDWLSFERVLKVELFLVARKWLSIWSIGTYVFNLLKFCIALTKGYHLSDCTSSFCCQCSSIGSFCEKFWSSFLLCRHLYIGSRSKTNPSAAEAWWKNLVDCFFWFGCGKEYRTFRLATSEKNLKVELFQSCSIFFREFSYFLENDKPQNGRFLPLIQRWVSILSAINSWMVSEMFLFDFPVAECDNRPVFVIWNFLSFFLSWGS